MMRFGEEENEVITMAQTEAQKRAEKKYRSKLKMWYIRLPQDLHTAIETKRKEEGLTRKQVLERYLKGE